MGEEKITFREISFITRFLCQAIDVRARPFGLDGQAPTGCARSSTDVLDSMATEVKLRFWSDLPFSSYWIPASFGSVLAIRTRVFRSFYSVIRKGKKKRAALREREDLKYKMKLS